MSNKRATVIFDFKSGRYVPQRSRRGQELAAAYQRRADAMIARQFARALGKGKRGER